MQQMGDPDCEEDLHSFSQHTSVLRC